MRTRLARLIIPAAALAAALAGGCDRRCSPPCRDGFVCVKSECVSECNPPCPSGQICRLGACIPDDRMPDPDVIVNVPLTTDSAPPPPPAPEVAFGKPSVTCQWDEEGPYRDCTDKGGGKPALAALERFAEKHFDKLETCRSELKARSADAKGVVTVLAHLDFLVGGAPDAVSVLDASLDDADLKKCVTKALRSLRATECCEHMVRLTIPVYFDVAPPPADTGVPPAP